MQFETELNFNAVIMVVFMILFLCVQYTDAYNATDMGTQQFPLGAPISIVLRTAEDPLAPTPEYRFLPLYHTPLQQPNITTTGASTVAVSYTHASASLSGAYILCRVEPPGPALCGGKIAINVTSK